jgi:hypothetical protein
MHLNKNVERTSGGAESIDPSGHSEEIAMRKMTVVTSSAIALLMGGTMMAPMAGAAQITSAGTTVATHAPAKHQVQTRRICKRVVSWRHHHKVVHVVCHTVHTNMGNHDDRGNMGNHKDTDQGNNPKP